MRRLATEEDLSSDAEKRPAPRKSWHRHRADSEKERAGAVAAEESAGRRATEEELLPNEDLAPSKLVHGESWPWRVAIGKTFDLAASADRQRRQRQ